MYHEQCYVTNSHPRQHQPSMAAINHGEVWKQQPTCRSGIRLKSRLPNPSPPSLLQNTHTHPPTYLLAPIGSQLLLLHILRVALPCLQAIVYSVSREVNSRSSWARERFYVCRKSSRENIYLIPTARHYGHHTDWSTMQKRNFWQGNWFLAKFWMEKFENKRVHFILMHSVMHCICECNAPAKAS